MNFTNELDIDDNNYYDVLFETVLAPEGDCFNISAVLRMHNIEDDEEKILGYASIYLFNEFMLDTWDNLLDISDSISGDVLEVMYVLEKAKENENIFGLITVIDHIEIYNEYRNKGYSSILINKIIEYFNYINVNYVGLIPARIYSDRVVQNEDKAIQYYINKGFKPLSRHLDGDLVMGKSLI
ncbi:hypothetical protein EXM56_06565 [Clostridium botulinum]|uniref:N-acetyltransferase domain-containing protein n=1 Tax=Clostridium botulinum TaxID=1491 RepID=A0A6G4CQ68_CLOBO|nr:hypothetical protein [Clostridium botulinum]NEZ98412.1 hypothetical protein [Clostridium botulinum]NFA30029.1 hypothetical protein [Clostridium botulinum]NFA85717.1 hypothetical protein [Clostridium botulinum]NFB05068.1 hypothetical protein [Clostridium botulinum]